MEIPQVLEACETSKIGLSKAEAADRLRENGPNALSMTSSRSLFAMIWSQMSLITVILFAAAIISGTHSRSLFCCLR